LERKSLGLAPKVTQLESPQNLRFLQESRRTIENHCAEAVIIIDIAKKNVESQIGTSRKKRSQVRSTRGKEKIGREEIVEEPSIHVYIGH
jgi:hypothetical protein